MERLGRRSYWVLIELDASVDQPLIIIEARRHFAKPLEIGSRVYGGSRFSEWRVCSVNVNMNMNLMGRGVVLGWVGGVAVGIGY